MNSSEIRDTLPAPVKLVVEHLNFLEYIPLADLLHTLSETSDFVHLRERQELIKQGDPVDHIYLVIEGSIHRSRISQDKQGRTRQTLRKEIGPGALIGGYDLLYHQPYSARARALEPCTLISIDSTAVNRLIYRFPEIRHQLAPLKMVERLRLMPILSSLDLTTLSFLAGCCERQTVEQDELIYGVEDTAESLYFIDQGHVQLSWPDDAMRWLGNGMTFGFLDQQMKGYASSMRYAELAYGHEAKALCTTECIQIPRQEFIEISGLLPEVEGHRLRNERERVYRDLPVFANFSVRQRLKLLGLSGHCHIPSHHLVLQQGEMSDSLWLLMPGREATLHALSDEGEVLPSTRLYGPNFFSEMSLRVEYSIESTIEAEPGSQWMRLHREDFQIFLDEEGDERRKELVISQVPEDIPEEAIADAQYEWLGVGESIFIFKRRHWIVLLRNISMASGLAMLSLLILSFALAQGPAAVWAYWLLTPLALVTIGVFLWGWNDYQNDYLLVTNQRIIHQEKVLFLNEWRRITFLEKVQNIDIATTFIGTIFGYQNLKIQTASSQGAITFNIVGDSNLIKHRIFRLRERRRKHFDATEKLVIQNLLEERLGSTIHMPNRVWPKGERKQHKIDIPILNQFWDYIHRERHLRNQETDHIIWRKHWFILLGRMTLPFVVFLLSLGLMLTPFLFLPSEMTNWRFPLMLPAILAALAAIGWISWVFTDWRNDTYQINNDQIIDTEKRPLFFAETRRTAELGDIEDIEFEIPGPLHFLLDFGNVTLQTAAADGNFSFNWVPNPRAVSEEIRRRITLYQNREEQERAREQAEMLPEWFEMYSWLNMDRGVLGK